MNPSSFYNAPVPIAPAGSQPPPPQQQQPFASTSQQQQQPLNGANGLPGSSSAFMNDPMAIDGLGSNPLGEQPTYDKPKTRKDIEQEKKDVELGELLDMMDEWKPIIPDEVTDYYLQRSGFETDDVRVKRLLALAAQRFVSSISADAFQYARTRTAAGPGGRTKEAGTSKAKARTRTVLTMEDLSAALKEYGVGADRAAYYL